MFLYFRRFFCLIRFGKPAEDNDASALSVLCFPCGKRMVALRET